MVEGSWGLQQAGAKCLSRAIEDSPSLTAALLEELERRMGKVCVCVCVCAIVLIDHLLVYLLYRKNVAQDQCCWHYKV